MLFTEGGRPVKAFSLDHLDEVQFEEFCYDLLRELGFMNINWRKGTGLSTSPSDQGRDLECEYQRTDMDGTKSHEKWFVECKRSTRGIPPTAIQGILAWATAEDPDVVLLIASNFLSNPTKNYLVDYERNHKPRFKLKTWERPDLERLTLGKMRLLRKYEVVGEFPFLSILHPAHILYLKGPQINTLGYLFEVLDELEPKKRDDILSWVYEQVIRPRRTYRTKVVVGMPITVPDRVIDEVSYEAFKSKCHEMAESAVDERMLAFLIVSFVLGCQISISDTTSVDESVHRMEDSLRFYEVLLQECSPKERQSLEGFMERVRGWKENAQERTAQNYELYEYFCDNVVTRLLSEEYRSFE